MSVKIRSRKLNNNQSSLSLDFYDGKERWREALKLTVYTKVNNELEKQHNKRVNALAEARRADADLRLSQGLYVKASLPLEVEVFAYMEKFIREYKKADVGIFEATLGRFKMFYKKEVCYFSELNQHVCEQFRDYLHDALNGESGKAYFRRFTRMIKTAIKEELIEKDPTLEIKTVSKPSTEKDVLTLEEIRLLQQTDSSCKETKRAFLFACYTGLRMVDIKGIKYADIKGDTVTLVQSKTKLKTTVKISETAKQFIGEGKPTDKVFKLAFARTTILRRLNDWVRSAGIDKHITFHCARHSFGTNLIIKNVDVRIIAKLLGHSDLKMVMKYTRVADDILQAAVNKLDE